MKEISAGGVVYKREGDNLKIMIIEDRYMKASLPKGKVEKGETLMETALREIKEETGITGKIVEPLEVIHYRYYHPEHGQIDKEVHYFLVEALSGELTAQLEEINSVAWFSPREAWKKLKTGYENNYSVTRKAFKLLKIPPAIME
ncbi:MAG: NUDIX hydrolase [Bacillaceae bacterium]|nr:NUDIX hydrolase [Bacillaceae bacterium]